MSADVLIDPLWGPERDGALERLQMAIVRLRTALASLESGDGSVLRTFSGGYLLSVRLGELASEVFAVRVREGRRTLGPQPGEALGLADDLEVRERYLGDGWALIIDRYHFQGADRALLRGWARSRGS